MGQVDALQQAVFNVDRRRGKTVCSSVLLCWRWAQHLLPPAKERRVQVDSARLKWTPNLHSHVYQVLRKYVVRVPPTLRCPDAAEWTDNWPRPSTFHETLSRDASRWRSPPSRHCRGRRIPT